ncbi:MAG TPA: hypothetical protein VGK99_17740 [Acidobacteriota bacterium]|jgi:hypothetical protein
MTTLKPGESFWADYKAGGKTWRLIVEQEVESVLLTVEALASAEVRITGRAATVEGGQRKLIEAAEAILGPATEKVTWEFTSARAL